MRKPCKPLCLQPVRLQGGASVQQGLSAAFEFSRLGCHRGAADKRYSLGVIERGQKVSPAEANNRLLQLWNTQSADDTFGRIPAMYEHMEQNALVFVGLNPSFSVSGWNSLIARAEGPRVDPDAYFVHPTLTDFSIKGVLRLEALAHAQYPFFAQHHMLAKRLDMKWYHIDLFACRETDQARVRSRVVASAKPWTLTPFGSKQFCIFESLLGSMRPKLVIVVNALASHIYKHQRSQQLVAKSGAYEDQLSASKFPVLLSGMLTGARSLDTYSRERLFWHAEQLVRVR